MNFLNIPANYNFLSSLYKFINIIFKNNLNISNLTILLPSRRSANELKRIFLENSRNKSTILPNIKAIGDIDYDDILFNSSDLNLLNSFEDITKPISNIKYKLLIIKEILNNSKNLEIEQAINLANELNKFLNDVEKYNLNLDNLDTIVDEEYAIHWQKILNFLKNFGKKWQEFLSSNNIISKNTYILKTIELETEIFKKNKPKYPILIAGNYVSVKATMELIRTLSKYDNTYFIFKGIENVLNNNEFNNINELHSHFYFKTVVKELNIKYDNIDNIKYDEYKIVEDSLLNTIYSSMLPAELTYKWHELVAKNLNNIKYIECKNNYEENLSIIIYILNYINKNKLKNIAIITDIKSSYQIELFLREYNLPYNNNFGKKFIFNDIVQYLFLVINTYIENFSPKSLLNILKHKFSYFGYTKDELQTKTMLFENNILKNKINKNGIKSYIYSIKNNIANTNIKQELLEFITRIAKYFNNLDKDSFLLRDLLVIHLNIAEQIATNNEINGQDILWFSDRESERVFEFLQDLVQQSQCYELLNKDEYLSILNYLLSEQSYNEEYTKYPAVNLISAQESRLINYDLVIISNLNDGIFPANIATDPWMSKSMRKNFGLLSKDVDIGKSAYDFIQLLSQKEILITRSTKINGLTTFKSRFLQKIETFLKCHNLKLQEDLDTINTVKLLTNCNYNINNEVYKNRPNPKPSLKIRKLEKLSATNIDLLNKNPYDIYAKKILKLYKKNVIEKQNIFAKLGTIIHSVFEEYCKNYEIYKSNTIEKISNFILKVLQNEFIDDNVSIQLYYEKIILIFKEFLKLDQKSRNEGFEIFPEEWKEYKIINNDIIIEAKIDRIELNGNIVKLIDYKTGSIPSKSDIIDGKKLQLPIEAMILKRQNNYNVVSLQHWVAKIKNNSPIIINDGDKISINEIIDKTEKFICSLLSFFENENNGFIATSKNIETSDYTHLSRLEEWLYE